METTSPWTIWYDAVTALDRADAALNEAYRASHPSREQIDRAIETRDAARIRKEEARLIVNAAQDALDRAEEATAVAEAMSIINRKAA